MKKSDMHNFAHMWIFWRFMDPLRLLNGFTISKKHFFNYFGN